jgi:hypothetical protein
MHFTLSNVALVASGLISVANANFDIYRVHRTMPYAQGGSDIIWQIFPADPSCDVALNTEWVPNSYDVSGNKLGVRCKGSGCSAQAPPENIDVLEMHLKNNPLWHWSRALHTLITDHDCELTYWRLAIYKDRGYSMVGCRSNQILLGKLYTNRIHRG